MDNSKNWEKKWINIKVHRTHYDAISNLAKSEDKVIGRVLERAIENYLKQRRMTDFLIKEK